MRGRGTKRSENMETEGVRDEEADDHPLEAKYTKCQLLVWRRWHFKVHIT